MKRIALIAASSVAALVSSLALAQPQPAPPAGGNAPSQQQPVPPPPAPQPPQAQQQQADGRGQRRDDWRERREDRIRAQLDERLGQVRDELKLRPEQVPLWEKLEALLRERSTERRDHWAEMRAMREKLRHADIMERIDARARMIGERADTARALADTVRPLWTTLSDEQKTVLRRSVRDAMERGHGRVGERGDRDQRWHRSDRDDERGPRHWRDDRRGGPDGPARYDRDDRRSGQNSQGRYDGRDDGDDD